MQPSLSKRWQSIHNHQGHLPVPRFPGHGTSNRPLKRLHGTTINPITRCFFLRPVAPTPPAPRVNALHLHPVPPPRVVPRRSARLAAAAPRVAPHPQAPQVKTTQPPAGPTARTRSKNPNFRTVAQEAIFSFATLNLLNLSPASLSGRRFPLEMLNAVLNEETGEIMEYRQIMKSPNYRNL